MGIDARTHYTTPKPKPHDTDRLTATLPAAQLFIVVFAIPIDPNQRQLQVSDPSILRDTAWFAHAQTCLRRVTGH